MELNVQNAKEFILSDKFREFLMSNTTDFAPAAFVLQTLLNEIERI